ncbi:hypothetical protein [Streptomyces hydrogenans]|uniref:hypothetical protein n=1 Tax=Streptomyces hydrogenans TaxID=1873719 RepID=UPI0035D638A2
MNELKPIDGELAPEVRALVEALRELFAGLGVSTRRYAARRAYDSSTISRYLSGHRPSPWEFVLNLLHDVAEERGTTPTAETIALLRSLHAAAVQAGKSPAHKVQLLERQLAEADQEARRAVARERWLEDTLQDREHRIRDLEIRNRELQALTGMPSRTGGGPSAEDGSVDGRAQLRNEIRDLQEELARVRALHRDAEERCERLERLLAASEEQEGRTSRAALLPVPAPYGDPDSGATLRSTSGTYHFGEVNGTVNLFTDAWQVDEELVASVTVHVRYGNEHLGNGLLLDGRTVLTAGAVLQPAERGEAGGQPLQIGIGEQTVDAFTHSSRSMPGFPDVTSSVGVLRLAEAVPFPDRPLSFDWRLTPGRQLLVGAHTSSGPYSCLLNVTGRTGDWLRVTGELTGGLGGAPAFSTSGSIAGLIMGMGADGERRGLVLPSATLRAFGALLPDG